MPAAAALAGLAAGVVAGTAATAGAALGSAFGLAAGSCYGRIDGTNDLSDRNGLAFRYQDPDLTGGFGIQRQGRFV